jgi:hypothetical protein
MGEMNAIRRRLTYANVAATVALFLALGGGAVYAAGKITSGQIAVHAVKNPQLAKNAVRARNLANKAVKNKNIGGNAVTAHKIGKGAVTGVKLGKGSLIIADASGGPVTGINVDDLIAAPLSGQTSFTPVAGEAYTLGIEVQGTLTQPGPSSCQVSVAPLVNGAPLGQNSAPTLFAPGSDPVVPNGIQHSGAAVAWGLTTAGATQHISAEIIGSSNCGADSRIDSIQVVVERAR